VSGQREHRPVPSRPLPAVRTRNSAPVDLSERRFRPARLYRKQPRFRFERSGGATSWRDLILPEEARRY